MDWDPTYFPDRRFPATWTGGDHEWAITERTARTRLREGRGLTTAFSHGGVPHTVLRLSDRAWHAVEHVAAGRPDLVYRLTFADRGRVTSLGVLPPDRHHAFGSTDPHVLYETLDPSRRSALAALGARTSRHTGDIRSRHHSREPLTVPTQLLTALHDWDPTEALTRLVDLLPELVDRAEAGPWYAYVDDSRERRDAVVARLRADERAEALLTASASAPRGLFRRRRKPATTTGFDPLLVGADGLRDLLAGTGRPFRIHREDGSRIVTSPVPDGEVTFAVTVRTQPGLALAASGMVVYLADSKAAWTVRRRDHGPAGDLTSDDAAALAPLVDLGLEVYDAFVEEFATPVRRALDPVGLPPPAY